MQRPAALARFIAAFDACLQGKVGAGHPANDIAGRMCQALRQPSGETGNGVSQALPACRHLAAALDHTRVSAAPLAELADAFQAIAPELFWRRSTRPATPSFDEGHANAEFVGPDGIEQRSDV